MAAREPVAFPPVIVYTGRDLSRRRGDALRRYLAAPSSSRARARPSGCSTRSRCSCTGSRPTCRPSGSGCCAARATATARSKAARVLVVDDDVRNIFALTSVLEPRGTKVVIARNGREALDAPARRSPDVDLVLMDIMMPEMDGFDSHARDPQGPELRRLPIIALTAKAMKGDREKCLDAGANDYIAKPVDIDKLLSLVAGLDAQVTEAAKRGSDDIELHLLLEAIYQKYHYDFRGYAEASLQARVNSALVQLRVRERISSCRNGSCTSRASSPSS